jgi:basic amino acid/polyamine antiporter, APA family
VSRGAGRDARDAGLAADLSRPEPRAPRPATDAQLIRALGTWSLAAAIVNVTIGGGIFRAPGSPELSGRLGAAAPVAYLLCAFAMGLIVLCIAEAASRVSVTGGPYAYVEVAFGPFVGYLVGVLLWVTATTAFAAVATIFADNAARVIPQVSGWGGRAILLAAVLLFFTATNIVGVRQGARVNVVAAVVKLVPLLLLIAGGIFAVDPTNVRWAAAPSAADVTRASIFLIFVFAGIESALVPSGEVRAPSRTVPRAVFIAMAGVTVIYLLIQIVAQGVLGPALVGSATPLTDAAGKVFGPWGASLLSAGVLLSTLGYLSGMTLAVPRALFAFGRDGFLPRALASVHPRFHTPHVAIATQAVLVFALALTSGFEALVILANLSVLSVYLGCCVAAWELRRRDVRGSGPPFRVPGGATVPILACVVILGLLSSITGREWATFGAVAAIAAALYLTTQGRRGRARAALEQPAA